jgi:hypothetical protein
MRLVYRPIDEDLKKVSGELLQKRDLLYQQLNEFTYTYPLHYQIHTLEPFLRRMQTTHDVQKSLREMSYHITGSNDVKPELMPLFESCMDLFDRLPECPIDELDSCCEGIKSDVLELLSEWTSEDKPVATGVFYTRL